MITKDTSALPPGLSGLKVGSLKANSEASKGKPRPVPQLEDIPPRPAKHEVDQAAPAVRGAKQSKAQSRKDTKPKPAKNTCSHRVNSRLDQATMDMVMKRAQEEDRTPSTVIRKALEAWAESERRKEKRASGAASSDEG